LALAAVTPVPAVLAGAALAIMVSGSTLNLQSFLGTIMAVGVATANGILLVVFAENARRAGVTASAAGLAAAAARVRPVLMTNLAMIAGMMPMALGVVGGLLAATAATLIVLPAVYAVLMRRATTASASLDPHDPASRYHVSPRADHAI
jgi:multidrug efflux pump subunit AcrB